MIHFTRADLTIASETTAHYGGPILIVEATLPDRWAHEEAATVVRQFKLQSTEGLDKMPKKEHGYHLFALGPRYAGYGDGWRGAFHTIDRDEVLDSLAAYLNELQIRQLTEATVELIPGLREAVDDFYASLTESSPRDYLAEWARVRDVFSAINASVYSAEMETKVAARATDPKTPTTILSVRIPSDQHARLHEIAKGRDVTVTDIIRELVTAYLATQEVR